MTGESHSLFLGIDQHARQLTISLGDQQGDVLLARQVSTRTGKIYNSSTNSLKAVLSTTNRSLLSLKELATISVDQIEVK